MLDLRFWLKRDKFLILEVLPEAIDGLIVSVDQEKHLRLEHVAEDIGSTKLASYLQVHRLRENVVVAADSSLVYTAVLPVSFPQRERKDEPVSAIELENGLAQIVGRIFNQCRTEASKALATDDLDVVLVNSQVLNFKIDGHQVLNPLGFRAKRIDAVLELTLTTRAVFERLKELLKARAPFFFTETMRAELVALRKVRRLPIPLLFLHPGDSRSVTLEETAAGHRIIRSMISWRADGYAIAIQNAFGVGPSAANDMYAMYLAHKLSATAERQVARLIKIVDKGLFDAIRSAKLKGHIYLNFEIPLPFSLPHKTRGMVLAEPPLHELLEKLGLSISSDDWNIPENQIFRHLAPFVEFYYCKSDLQVNQWLKRHLNWLGASA